jgi:hypothetical protein
MQLRIPVSATKVGALQAILALNLTEEKRALGIPAEEADKLEVELKRFFIMQALEPGDYVIPGPVDELWHAFLTDEETVRQLETGMGVRIAHRPDNPEDKWLAMRESTKETYKRFFGPAPALYADYGMLCWGCGWED